MDVEYDVVRDVQAARSAMADLRRAVTSLRQHYQDSVDVHRLELDAQRLAEDLDLLVGPERPSGPAPRLEVIEDREYPPDFWAGAEGEGIGPR